MSNNVLQEALSAVKWSDNVNDFLKDQNAIQQILNISTRLMLWSNQLEQVERGNPALSFIREMQVSNQHVATLIALALYKPAAASIRTMLETAMYFTYFRTHPDELASLHRDKDYYISKEDILEFHKQHSPNFTPLQMKLGLVKDLKSMYKKISAIVHGQVPGAWQIHTSIKDIKHNNNIKNMAVADYISMCDIIHRLFLCTLAQIHWDDFSPSVKKPLLSGLSGELKTVLQLDLK